MKVKKCPVIDGKECGKADHCRTRINENGSIYERCPERKKASKK